MAKDKKSFVLYADLIHTVKKMNREDAGELLLHILKYVNDESPETDNLIVDLTFEPIKQQFKRDLKKWENTIEVKSKGGRIGNLKRWNVDLFEKVLSKQLTLEEAEIIAENRKTSDTDKKHRTPSQNVANIAVNDNVTVSVSVNDISTNVDNVEIKNFSDDVNLKNAEILKFESPSWIESVAMQQKIKIKEIQNYIDEFVLFLKTTEKVHNSKKEFISHFINWLPKKLKDISNGKKQSTDGFVKKQFRFSSEESTEAIISSS